MFLNIILKVHNNIAPCLKLNRYIDELALFSAGEELCVILASFLRHQISHFITKCYQCLSISQQNGTSPKNIRAILTFMSKIVSFQYYIFLNIIKILVFDTC